MKEFIFKRNGLYDMTISIFAVSENQAKTILNDSVKHPHYYRLEN